MIENKMRPVHPGEILKEEFMQPYGMSSNYLAQLLEVPPNRISSILREKRSLTADTALRLSSLFGTTPQFWLGLQRTYDLKMAQNAIDPNSLKTIQDHQKNLSKRP